MKVRLLLSLALAGLLFSAHAYAETASYRETTILSLGYRTATGSSGSVDTGTAMDDEPPTGCRVFLNVEAGPTATTTTTLGAWIPDFDKLLAWLGPESAWASAETLTVKIVASVKGADYILHTFTAVTGATSSQTAVLTECPPQLRADYTISGTTPGFTFEVVAARY